MVKYTYGWWCPWCSTWVDFKSDTHEQDGQRLHNGCGNVVDRRKQDVPTKPSPPSPEVLAAHRRHRQMVEDFMRAVQ